MKRACVFLLALLSLLPLLSACQSEPIPALREGYMRLSENSVSPYRVIVSQEASEDTKKMAGEFISYFEKITGARLPLGTDAEEAGEHEILIGKTTRALDAKADYSTLGDEGFLYLVENPHILLTGNTDRAVAYAVYGFLEESFGVRYYSADFEKVPEKKTLDILASFSTTRKPGMWFRSLEGSGCSDPVYMVKLRLNTLQSLGSETYRRHPSVGGGHGWADWFVHTLGKLAEMEKNEQGNFNNVQPCLTDETVYQTVLKNVRNWMKLYPEAKFVSISQNDGTSESAMCSCDNCKEFYKTHGNVQSALFVNFVSRVATELKDEYPNVYFDTLAYNFTLMAPRNLEIPENVIIRIAPAFSCMNHAYSPNAEQQASAKASNAFEDWSKLTDNLFIWDYNTLFNNYWAPLTNFETLRQNFNLFASYGVQGVNMQGSPEDSFGEMRTYLTAKLLWEPDMSQKKFENLMREFMDDFYGAGSSEPLMEYIEFFNEHTKSNHFHLYAIPFINYGTLDVTEHDDGTVTLNTAPVIDVMKSYFDRAEEFAKTDAEKLHLKKARIQVKLYELLALFRLKETYENASIDEEQLRKLNQSVHEDVLATGLSFYCEGGAKINERANYDKHPKLWHHGL